MARAPRLVRVLLGCLLLRGTRALCGVGEVYLSVYVDDGSVADKDSFGKSDPYCKVFCGGHEEKTKTKNNDNNPDWEEMLELGCVLSTETIRLKCWDEDNGKDDELLDEDLPAQQWYVDGTNGQQYRLGGSKNHVDIEVYWVEAPTVGPTSVPTAVPSSKPSPAPTTAEPSPQPSSTPTPAPSALPTSKPTTAEPSPMPSALSVIFAADGVRAVQETDSKLYDSSSALACYDSPRLGERVEFDGPVRVVTRTPTALFVATRDGGPWHGLKLLLHRGDGFLGDISSSTQSDCFAAVRGTVVEVDGETALANAALVQQSHRNGTFCGDATTGESSSFDAYYAVDTTDLAGGCGGLLAESLEGVPVTLRSQSNALVLQDDDDDDVTQSNSTRRLASTSRRLLSVDDGSGPSLAVVGEELVALSKNYSHLNPGDQLVVDVLRGVVEYTTTLGAPTYAVRVTSMEYVKVGNWTDAPTVVPTPAPSTATPSSVPTLTPTPDPTPAPSNAPTSPRPSPAPTDAPTAVPSPVPTLRPRSNRSSSTSKVSRARALLVVVLVLVLVLVCVGCCFLIRRCNVCIPRVPYDSHSASSSVTEHTFEMGVVKSILYDPDKTQDQFASASEDAKADGVHNPFA